MRGFVCGLIIALGCFLFSACDSGDNYAPVTDLSSIEPIPHSGAHQVMPGETLYEIAWRYGLDYRYLSQLNQIPAPFTIHIGQVIYLNETKQVNRVSAPAISETKAIPVENEPNYSSSGWVWPAKGSIITRFSTVNKGVNIANALGTPIYAAASGKVVYSGSGLRGYGNLIIIKHNSLYLSAYAHNNNVFVRDGEWVKQGQKIAEMGSTGSDKVMLHFEIRKAGKPINPLSLYQSN
jgi:lipoprotein NlpD